MSGSGFNGVGRLKLQGDVDDLDRPFGYSFDFKATDYVDFSVVGGMVLPDPPGAESMRGIYATASSETNATPFYCNDSLREETYTLEFPATVPIIAIPRSSRFGNAAGEYEATLEAGKGSRSSPRHRLSLKADPWRRPAVPAGRLPGIPRSVPVREARLPCADRVRRPGQCAGIPGAGH